jgi:hypothetical protein
MSAERDMTRIVRSWLQVDEHESADRVLDIVLDLVDTTPQHRSRWPVRRIDVMNTYAKFAIAAAALLVVALVGYNLLPARGGVGGPPATPSPTPSPSLSASPEPPADAWPAGSLEASTPYHVTMNGSPMTLTMPSDRWRTGAIPGAIETGVFRADDHAWMSFIGGPSVVGTEPCAGRATPVPQTLAGAAQAYTTIPGTHAVGPTDARVGGRPAKLVVLTIDPNIPCSPNRYWMFGQGSAYPDSLDSIIRTWIIEVDGELFEIDSQQAAPNARLDQEIQKIVDSIRFE